MRRNIISYIMNNVSVLSVSYVLCMLCMLGNGKNIISHIMKNVFVLSVSCVLCMLCMLGNEEEYYIIYHE